MREGRGHSRRPGLRAYVDRDRLWPRSTRSRTHRGAGTKAAADPSWSGTTSVAASLVGPAAATPPDSRPLYALPPMSAPAATAGPRRCVRPDPGGCQSTGYSGGCCGAAEFGGVAAPGVTGSQAHVAATGVNALEPAPREVQNRPGRRG